MRKITAKERRRAGNIYCDHCKLQKVDAVWRASHSANHQLGDFACEVHKRLIYEGCIGDDHLTEADYQTWMRV